MSMYWCQWCRNDTDSSFQSAALFVFSLSGGVRDVSNDIMVTTVRATRIDSPIEPFSQMLNLCHWTLVNWPWDILWIPGIHQMSTNVTLDHNDRWPLQAAKLHMILCMSSLTKLSQSQINSGYLRLVWNGNASGWIVRIHGKCLMAWRIVQVLMSPVTSNTSISLNNLSLRIYLFSIHSPPPTAFFMHILSWDCFCLFVGLELKDNLMPKLEWHENSTLSL